jgi:hypothetical protein
VNKPTLVSSSAQVNTGSFTGSFTGNFLGSASYAQLATSASYFTGSLTFPAGLIVTGSVTASIGYTGSFTGSLLGSSSYALSASWAPTSAGGDFNTLVNKPTLVSSSAQVNTGSFTGSFTGNLLGSASYASTDWSAVNNKPVGIVSSSVQVVSNILGQSISPSIVSSSTIYITGSLAVSGTSAFTGSVNFYNGIGPVTIAGALYTTASLTINSGTTLIASVPTGSYDMTTFNYVIKSGSHARAGSVIGVWSASVVEYTDVSTNDIGNTGQFSFVMDVSQSNARLRGTTPTDTWLVKTIIHAI